jgi:hypothetical protein
MLEERRYNESSYVLIVSNADPLAQLETGSQISPLTPITCKAIVPADMRIPAFIVTLAGVLGVGVARLTPPVLVTVEGRLN